MDDLDLSIFKEIDSDECTTSPHSKCTVLKRLFVSLKYYSKLNITSNEDHKEIYRHFMAEVHPTFIDDFIHFKNDHSHCLQQIHADLIETTLFAPCDINKCNFTSRHYGRRVINDDDNENDIKNPLDPRLNFYKNEMDSFHFYLFHCFDVGLRIKKDINDETPETNEFDDKKEDKYFDAVFNRINKGISEREHLTASFDRFSTKNGKYNIATETNTSNMNKNGNDNDDKMYLEHLCLHLMRVKVNIIDINVLFDFINYHEYDTDAVEFDHGLKSNGNLVKNIKNTRCLTQYNEFIVAAKVSASSFSVGLRYYYWDYYRKDLNDMDQNSQRLLNGHDHSGYNYTELFVAAKYSSFEEEISNYKHISLKCYKEDVLVKVKQYFDTEIIKKTSATFYGTSRLHYGINKGDPIRFQHLLSLTLYTDFTDLCSAFSGTFRKSTPFETLESMIARNSSYYYMSKNLRECVEIYGQKRWSDYRYSEKGSCLSGPFYCGVNVVMNMDSFTLRLCGPTSTSKQITVSMKFCGDKGMVLQLNNPDIYPHYFLFGFNASWISQFPEEDERLFIGGLDPIQIETVRIRETKRNFKDFIYALYCLDLILNGGQSEDINVKKCDVSIIKYLMNATLSKQKAFDAYDYIHDTFVAFTQHKTKIVVRLEDLYNLDEKFCDLLMNQMEKREQIKEEKRNEGDLTNLLKSEIFEIFRNVQTVIIYSNLDSLQHSFSVSMMSLLSLIESYGVNEVMVKALNDEDNNGFNWINALWSSSSEILRKEFENKKYTISVKKIENENYPGYDFVINKMK